MKVFEVAFLLGYLLRIVHTQESPTPTFIFPKDNPRNWKTRIIGGSPVSPSNLYPHQAALFITYSQFRSLCGGSLVTNQWVITAAHCVDNSPLYVDVTLGAYNLVNGAETTRQTFRTKQWFMHPSWQESTLRNDIALVRLPRNATFNQNVGVIQLAAGTDLYAGVTGAIIGWGLTENGVTSNPLLQVQVQIMTNVACRATNPIYQVVQPSHLCTSGVGTLGSCQGDSGGPLMVNNIQVGVVSFGTDVCTSGYPSVFTRVTTFSTWIAETIERGGSVNLRADLLVLGLLALFIIVR